MSAALLLVLALSQAAPAADDDECVVLTNVCILTVGKGDIETGTIVIHGGKIVAVGADVPVPAGARVLDRKGMTAFPGLVHALSRLGMPEGPPDATGASQLALDDLNPLSDALGPAARCGVTTFAIQPSGVGIAGRGAILKSSGGARGPQVVEKSAFLRIVLQTGTAPKDALRQALEGARKAFDADRKKVDEKTLPLLLFLKGELPAIVEAGTPAELLHFWQVLDAFSDCSPRVVIAAPLDAYKVAGALGSRKSRVILRPYLALAPFTRERINNAAELERAGAQVAFAPISDSPEGLQGIFFRMGELVKYGLSRETALRGLTLSPAEMLGIDKRVGSIEAGKDADLILFSGDPLSPQARIREVYIDGRPVLPGE